MLLEDAENLDASSILSEELFKELFDVESEFTRVKYYNRLVETARSLQLKTAFEKLYRAYQKDLKRTSTQLTASGVKMELEQMNQTNFECLSAEEQLFCGMWKCDDQFGVRMDTEKGEVVACLHPIFPIQVLRNAEDGTCKIEIGFYFREQFRTVLVEKSVIASTSKILQLADHGILVNAITAPYLVKYFSEMEQFNKDTILERVSSSKLGWIKNKSTGKFIFIPYDGDVIFDSEQRMKTLFNSITRKGDKEQWYEFVRAIRKRNQPEFILSLDAAFASSLIELCEGLPFVFDLYGTSGCGKSVILNVVTSVWGNPQDYMADAKGTSTAMEVRLNTLNSLPMCLDDLAQLSQTEDDFGRLIYAWCSGKPKDRSNVNLGLSRGGRWRNVIITNGERALSTENMQGGAVNRIIDIEASGEIIFTGKEGNAAVNFVKENYGFAGHDWIFLLKTMGAEEVNKVYKKWFDSLRDEVEKRGMRKSDKQIMAMAFLFTAHEITTETLFKDNIQLDLDYCINAMKDLDEVDENKRAYEAVVSSIQANDFHLKECKDAEFEKTTQCWGFYIDEEWIAILPNIFDNLVKENGFQPRSFKSWCAKQGKLERQGKQFTKVIWEGGVSRRYVVFKASFNDEEKIEREDNENGFENLTNDEITPFN